MTKKITLVFVLFLFVFGLRIAESLLNEGFEGWSTTNFPTGSWTVINDTQEGLLIIGLSIIANRHVPVQ